MIGRNLSWPAAFALVFGGVPMAVLLVFAVCAYPVPALCFSAGTALFVLGDRAGRRRAALATRAAAEYSRNAELVAAPLDVARIRPAPSADPNAHTRLRPIEPLARPLSAAPTVPLRKAAS